MPVLKHFKSEKMDVVVELKIKNPRDWAIIERLLKRLNVSFVQKNVEPRPITKEQTTLDKLNALLDAGVDASYYGDPVEYQRNAREDINLPYRD